jgi:RNA polymerase sigma-70 factor (ECF subfamily)
VRTLAPIATGQEPRTEAHPDFEEFYRAEHVRLYRALYLVTGDRAEAEELMQEAFLRMWERWPRVSRLDDPQGYLFRTAMNAFRSRLRRAARRARVAMGRTVHQDPFAAADARDQVVRALRHLTPRQRAALVLTELLGFGTEEAARALGVKAGTVRSLSSQARSALRRTLDA